MVEDFYRRHKMPACFQMCSAALPENLASVLAARGYRDEKHTAVMTAPIEEVLSLTQPAQVIPVEGGSLSEAWFQAYTTASGYNEESLPFRRGILTRIGPAANFLLLEVDGKPAGVGLGVIERGWMGVFCVVTFPDLRRQGLAMQVMHGLAVWGKTSGVDQVYLQVMLDNLPAIGLYDRLGFQRMYTYHYAVKPSI
jgi:GNAT superfamily N-acetyltransferase